MCLNVHSILCLIWRKNESKYSSIIKSRRRLCFQSFLGLIQTNYIPPSILVHPVRLNSVRGPSWCLSHLENHCLTINLKWSPSPPSALSSNLCKIALWADRHLFVLVFVYRARCVIKPCFSLKWSSVSGNIVQHSSHNN